MSPEAVHEVACCDVIFGCTDGAEARHLLNHIATFYSIPYFDVGVRLDADGQGEPFLTTEPEGAPCNILARHIGRGDVEPILDRPIDRTCHEPFFPAVAPSDGLLSRTKMLEYPLIALVLGHILKEARLSA